MKTRWFWAVLAAAWTSSCSGDKKADNSCEENADCTAPGTRCDLASKQCVCASDEACDENFFCNLAGVCQALAGCVRNSDCERQQGTYCDIASGQCLQGPPEMLLSLCGLATHCPYGTTCRGGRCEASCFDDGDCVLGQVCYQEQCVSGNGVCSSDPFCGYGELCSDRTVPSTCREDRRGPFCRGCTFRTAANPEPCDHPRNFCLINSLESGSFPYFCGVDCSLGQQCPNGYGCNGVVILTEDTCNAQADCRCEEGNVAYATATCTVAVACDPRLPNGMPDNDARFCRYDGQRDCNSGVEGGPASCFVPKDQRFGFCSCGTDSDCADGGTCVGGLCCVGEVRTDRDCVAGENRVSGYCTCATDDDCPRDVCDGSRGACAITGLPCTPGANDCGPIPCVEGGCLIGQNCAPLQGLSCSIVTADD
jgi:hypothetical protein